MVDVWIPVSYPLSYARGQNLGERERETPAREGERQATGYEPVRAARRVVAGEERYPLNLLLSHGRGVDPRVVPAVERVWVPLRLGDEGSGSWV